ncbi:translation initiation factor IF-2-like [Lutra lutra]|uniref:translation initiation factor IF-2-like n=1 Tax=Lutra lutra TaxID=9657 RepID=UPI001FCF9109|nr:translation initiation factor IF-2-like [Lutra lutra]XP_047593623.1 translation initiation factor IF-2-like [Lutra lutra]XP_047593624.1 translation initiation factor IF-2-like [Lutra lutra]XP_047593625.1 translation initiation factor IF-2-like [Lutra lutra]
MGGRQRREDGPAPGAVPNRPRAPGQQQRRPAGPDRLCRVTAPQAAAAAARPRPARPSLAARAPPPPAASTRRRAQRPAPPPAAVPGEGRAARGRRERIRRRLGAEARRDGRREVRLQLHQASRRSADGCCPPRFASFSPRFHPAVVPAPSGER